MPVEVRFKSNAGMRIGDLAQVFALRPSALRYYEKVGVLDAPRREAGRRVYDEEAVSRLALIVSARDAGFTISEISSVLSAIRSGQFPSSAWRRAATGKARAIRRGIDELQKMLLALTKSERCNCKTIRQCERTFRSKLLRPDIPQRGPK